MNDASIRLDKWLWYARFFKSRSLATKMINIGMRVNGQPVSKPHFSIRVGDVLTFKKGKEIRVIKILNLGTRRGSAHEAQALYDDLSPPVAKESDNSPRFPPFKFDRKKHRKSHY